MSEQASQPVTSGQVLKEIGGFELVAKIGQGGMGAVFKARQKSLDRIVALKVLPPTIAKDKVFIERFVREARSSAKLAHPNVVTGIDVGQDQPTGLWFFAMEFVDGPSCSQLLKQQGRLPEDLALKIARDVGQALECAHQNGIVHRDIKPDNILLTKTGTAKLADLGLARHTQDDASLTQSGLALGTPFYMPPEQVRGQKTGLDTRTDLYALGATLFHLVTGQTPFQGETSAVIMVKHLNDPPPMANRVCPDVSAGCSKLILKLMQKDKAQRIQTPQELIEQIDRLLRMPVASRGTTTGPRVPIRGATTTAPRDAVKPRGSTGPEAAAPRSGFTATHATIGAGLIVLVGLVAFAFSRKPPTSPQRPAPAKQETVTQSPNPALAPAAAGPSETKTAGTPPNAPGETPLERSWREAKAFAAAQPQAYEEILQRYRRLVDQANGQPQADEIEAEMMDLEDQYDAAAHEAWKANDLKIEECLKTGNYDAALAAAGEVPAAFAKRLAAIAKARREALGQEAQDRLIPVLEKAEAACEALDPQTGVDALKTIESVQFAPLANRRDELQKRLEHDLGNMEELLARRKLAELLGRFDAALLEKGDENQARRVAGEARNATELEPVRPQAEAMAAILDAAAEEAKRQEDANAAIKGRPFAIGKDMGTIDRIADGQLYVQLSLDGGKIQATKLFRIADLTPAQRDELFPPRDSIPAALSAREALRLLVAGHENLDAAAKALKSIPDFPLTPHYLQLIEARRAACAEAAAAEAWKTIAAAGQGPLNSPAQALPVFRDIQAFLQKHGKTAMAKARAAEIAALKAKVEAIASPNLLTNGDFETGDLTGWRLIDPNRRHEVMAKASPEAVHTGKYGLDFTRPGSAICTPVLEPGQTYRVSCWVKSIDAFIRVSLDLESRDMETTRQGSPTMFSDWTQISFTFTAEQPKQRIALQAIAKRTCRAFFDDVQVVKQSSDPVPQPQAVVPAAASVGASAQYVGDDVQTKGNWKKSYGKDGFILAGDEKRLPAYAILSDLPEAMTWGERSDDPRLLQRARGEGRAVAAWHSKRAATELGLHLTDGREHTVALYMLDFNSTDASARIEVADADNGKTLDTQTVQSYDSGRYLIWRLKGNVVIRILPFKDKRVYASGLFFD